MPVVEADRAVHGALRSGRGVHVQRADHAPTRALAVPVGSGETGQTANRGVDCMFFVQITPRSQSVRHTTRPPPAGGRALALASRDHARAMSAGSAKSSHCREPVKDRRPAGIGPLASTRRGYKDAPPAAPGSPAQSPSAPSGRETTWRAVDVRSILAAGAPDPRPAGAARNLAEVLDFSRPPNLAAPRYDVPPFAGLPCPVGGFADYEDWRALRDVALRSGWSLPA